MLWRSLLTNWIGRAAKERLYAEAMRAARQQAQGAAHAAPRSDAPADEEDHEDDATGDEVYQRPCDVGLIFALGIESGGFEDLTEGLIAIRDGSSKQGVKQGGVRGRHVVVARSGVGQQAARRATERLIAGHRPTWVISTGFAGALQPGLAPGDIVLADRLVDVAGNRLAIDLAIGDDERARPHLHVGRLLTAERVVHRARDKQAYGQRFDALAVDMETMAVAEACRAAKTRFLAVRVISDAMNEELPADLMRLIEGKTAARRAGAVIGTLFNRPSSVKDMLSLRERSLTASDRLAKFLVGTIEQLVPLAKPRSPDASDGG